MFEDELDSRGGITILSEPVEDLDVDEEELEGEDGGENETDSRGAITQHYT